MTSVATPWSACVDGTGRVSRAPAVLAGVWAITLLVTVPLTAVMRDTIKNHLGDSLSAEEAASGVNSDWMQEFSAGATGLATTFRVDVIGFGAVLNNLSAFLDQETRPIALVGATAIYLGLWTFLSAGIIDRYARNRVTGASGFFAACGGFVGRFFRLALVMGLAYWLLFQWVHPWLFGTVYPRLTHDLTVERTAFLIRALLYVAFGLVFAACNLVFDYTKVRAVVEDRRSMVFAVLAAIRFIRLNIASVVGLYVVDVLLFMTVLAAYGLVAPGAGGGGWSMWIAPVVGQVYVLARLWVKLVFWASETALFQGQLAHAGYVAAPTPVWPDSPMAEAIGN